MSWEEIRKLTSLVAARGFSVDYYNLKSEVHLDEGDRLAIMFVAGYLAAKNDQIEGVK
ncbi:MAG: hypothetical protein J7K90_09705 [Desulfuromusa sp.]|nr:hypothetical protein [Desulfuromusa sp.]